MWFHIQTSHKCNSICKNINYLKAVCLALTLAPMQFIDAAALKTMQVAVIAEGGKGAQQCVSPTHPPIHPSEDKSAAATPANKFADAQRCIWGRWFDIEVAPCASQLQLYLLRCCLSPSIYTFAIQFHTAAVCQFRLCRARKLWKIKSKRPNRWQRIFS